MVLVVFALGGCFLNPQSSDKEIKNVLADNEHILYGLPDSDCRLLYRKGYVLCYNGETKVADWASYHLTKEYLVSGVSRSNNFRPDRDLVKGMRSELLDYRGSGYDRGHLVPAADMARETLTMSESFLLSNMAPQRPSFNRGIWKVLESKVRNLGRDNSGLYVITGSLFMDADSQKTIGSNEVYVPSHFYKIIVAGNRNDPENLKAIAFIIPNASFPSSQLNSFIVTIDKVEEESGLDFLSDLDDSIENTLESENRLTGWFQN